MRGSSPAVWVALTIGVVDEKSYLNPESCDCDSEHGARSCKRVVMEQKRGDVMMRKSKDVEKYGELNLAALGWYQSRESMTPMKRVKNVVFNFRDSEGKYLQNLWIDVC